MRERAWAGMLQRYCPASSPAVSWCDGPVQLLPVGERSQERKTRNDVAQNLIFPSKFYSAVAFLFFEGDGVGLSDHE